MQIWKKVSESRQVGVCINLPLALPTSGWGMGIIMHIMALLNGTQIIEAFKRKT